MNKAAPDIKLIAYCGLYCGSCPMYQNNKCSGCKNDKSKNDCEIRNCCIEKNLTNCARCREFKNFKECRKLNNFTTKLFELIFRSDKISSVELLKSRGQKKYSQHMAENNLISIKK